MSDDALIASILERCEAELRRIDKGKEAPPGGAGAFRQLVRDIERVPMRDLTDAVLRREAVSPQSERSS